MLVNQSADSIFDVDLLIPLYHDAMSAVENEGLCLTHQLLG